VLGHAVRLSGREPSWVDFGVAPAYDAPEGFALEFFVRVDQVRNQILFSKGTGVVLRMENDGGLTLQVRALGKDEKGDPRPVFHSASSASPVLSAERFTKIVATFDGLQLRLTADDAVVAELVLQAAAPFAPDRQASLMCGSTDAPAGLVLDEVKWGIFAGDTQELRDMKVGDAGKVVRFGPDGALDPRFHTQPVDLLLVTPNGDAEHPEQKTWIRVGMLGDVH